VRAWVDAQLAEHAARAVPIAGLGFERLARCFSDVVLLETRSVTVARIPIPPFSDFGFPELASIETMAASGVTFKNVCFVHASVRSESIHFHEVVHAVQWRALGVDQFMLTYAMGLLQHGYAHSPLEAMAYDLQSQFDRGLGINDAETLIRDHALTLRDLTADLFRRHGLVMGQS
jgi:hypothetical protein